MKIAPGRFEIVDGIAVVGENVTTVLSADIDLKRVIVPIEVGRRDLNPFAVHLIVVIHPLDDLPEQKVDTESLGPMPMTMSVRISLLSLRAYLVLMLLLVFYHVPGMAGLLGHRG